MDTFLIVGSNVGPAKLLTRDERIPLGCDVYNDFQMHPYHTTFKAYLGYSALNSSRPEPAARFKTSVLSCCPSCTLYLLMMAFLCLFHSWNKVFLMIFLGERLMAYLHYAPNQQSFENMQRRASRRGVAPRQRTRATRSSWLGPGEGLNFGKPRHVPS